MSTDGFTRTACPYCGVGCGVLAKANADGTVSIAGDPEHPANFGKLCSKGSALGETLSLDGRLLFPKVGGTRASWDTALDEVANRFAQTIAEHGLDSVAFYVSGQILTEDYYAANQLMKGFIGSANIDTNSRLCMASAMATAHSVRFVTGHACSGELAGDLDWQGLADAETTLIVYMGGRTAGAIASRLAREGLALATPVVAVSRVSRPDQLRWQGTLADLAHSGLPAELSSPVLIGIGGVFAQARVEAGEAATDAEVAATRA